MLYTDPWYELRLLRNYPASGPAAFGQESPEAALRDAVMSYAPSDELRSELDESGLGGFFDDALAAIRTAPEFQQASKTAPADSLDHRRAIARAIIAYTIVAAQDVGEPPPDGQVRDALAERLANELHGYGMSVSSFLLSPVKGMATRMATRKLTGDRGSISDATAPAAGDILRFLANGDGARELVRQAIADVTGGPVLLLGHSLGGIICVDLLIRENIPAVAGLVTVGSQAPFLYEIGALPALTYPRSLPSHFPRWLNVYDRRDLLSYVGAGVLGDTVTDVEVDNGQPFPQSHSAYWSNPAVWSAVAGAVP